jgi:alpha-beta hydrolase superfamily lysophospholipase
MPGSEFELRTDDGQSLLARRWLPEGSPRAVVQIAHGLAEHSARYARLAAALNAAGYAVYASDLRGHGPKAAAADIGHFADEGGWGKVVGDLWAMNRLIAREEPGLSIIFLGHSTGSWLGQQFVSEHSDALAGVVIPARTARPRLSPQRAGSSPGLSGCGRASAARASSSIR